VVIKSPIIVHRVLAGTSRYVDWLPYDRTVKRATAFFPSGRPFVDLASSDARAMERLATIRNAIAHESGHALRVFHKDFVDGRGLPPDQSTPAGYLRGQHTAAQTRFAFLLADAVSAFSRLCS
jgi:hypothetical protein